MIFQVSRLILLCGKLYIMKTKILAIFIAALFPAAVFAQSDVFSKKVGRERIEECIHRSVKTAYASTARIWGFDEVKQVQTSAQFSGVVVTSDGYILTAAHVNTPGNTYKVMFPNGTSYIARGLGEIELEKNRTVPDVAMMKIIGEFKGTYAALGWSSSLKKNQVCISIAYPESLNLPVPTVRAGRIVDLNNQYGFIQSTCIMEPGDSGGPLFDCLGRVIGIHSAIDVAETDNFEIPIDLYRKYWNALKQEKTYSDFPDSVETLGRDKITDGGGPAYASFDKGSGSKYVTSKYGQSSLLIKSEISGKWQNVQGTLFTLEGMPLSNSLKKNMLVVSKNSLVGDNPVANVNGKRIIAKVILRDKKNDLVLLSISSRLKGGLKLSELNSDTLPMGKIGSFLISPLSDHTCRVGVLGNLGFEMPKRASLPYLGADVMMKQGGITLKEINPNSPASDAMLRLGDQVLSLNGTDVETRNDIVNVLRNCWPGDTVKIKILRADSAINRDVTLTRNIVLAAWPESVSIHPAEKFAGGKSVRRDGFKEVFVHDGVLRPEQCGGPVFDAEGCFWGINIARYSRTANLVMPVQIIIQLIETARELQIIRI